jgi:hypothetical protein
LEERVVPIVAGVDCHKDSHAIVVVDELGKVLRSFSIAASNAGYRQAIAVAKELGVKAWVLKVLGSMADRLPRRSSFHRLMFSKFRGS